MVGLAMNNSVRYCITVFLISGILLLTPGCAAIFCGVDDNVTIGPVSKETTVQVDGKDVAVPSDKPLEIALHGGAYHVVRFEREGYHPVEMTLRRVQNPFVVADAALWLLVVPGLVATLVDNLTGAAWDLDPAVIEVQMKKCEPGKHPHTILAN